MYDAEFQAEVESDMVQEMLAEMYEPHCCNCEDHGCEFCGPAVTPPPWPDQDSWDAF